MSEAELHVLRARLEGGIRNKAAARRAAPWAAGRAGLGRRGRRDPAAPRRGDPRRDRRDLRALRRARLGPSGVAVAAPRGRPLPAAQSTTPEIRWVTPSYHQVHSVLTNPVYAGAYAYGKTRRERYVDEHGQPRTRIRRLRAGRLGGLDLGPPPRLHRPRDVRAKPGADRAQHAPARARAGRRHSRGRRAAAGTRGLRPLRAQAEGPLPRPARPPRPAYHCPGSVLVEGRGQWCLRVGGMQIDAAVADALLAALTPAGVKAALAAAEALEQDHDAALKQWRLQVERARYEARARRAALPRSRARAPPRRPRPGARVGAGAQALAAAEAELALREQPAPPHAHRRPSASSCSALGADLGRVWSAPTTTDRDRKQLLRCLIEEVIVDVDARASAAPPLTLRWRGGALTELAVPLPRHQPTIRTDEDTIALLATARRPLPRRHDRRDPQPPRPPLRDRRALHRDHRRRPAPLPRHPRIPAARRAARGRAAPRRQGRRRARRRRLHHLPLAPGRLHRRRARHPRRSLADPRQRPAPRPLRRRRARRASSRSSTRCGSSASPARPSCSVSSAASSKPSTSARGRRKGLRIRVPGRRSAVRPRPHERVGSVTMAPRTSRDQSRHTTPRHLR